MNDCRLGVSPVNYPDPDPAVGDADGCAKCSDNVTRWRRGGGGVRGYSNIKVVYMCHGGFKNRGLREWTVTENGGGGGGGFQNWPTREKKGFWSFLSFCLYVLTSVEDIRRGSVYKCKNNKETYIFF